ncbi:MAG: hypothetical protein JXB30_06320 [Anaerolineae bacterium]|nr:hypothetical protein [Anaerolineae bacterium]
MPRVDHPDVPAWPEALDYLRKNQLPDGGWGEPHVLYAHERTLSTLAAIYALHTWQIDEQDSIRVHQGVDALHHYADLLSQEPDEPVGYELVLPSLWRQFDPEMQAIFPLEKWAGTDRLYDKKVSLTTSKLLPDPAKPRAWWFSMEALSQTELAVLDDRILAANGSIVTATAPTAAYLRAKRISGSDSPRAEAFLNDLVERGSGGVPFCDPAEIFERVWVLDNLRRVNESPNRLSITHVLDSIYRAWYTNKPGVSSSNLFPVNDGDDIAVGLTLLQWGGYLVDDQPLLNLWDSDHFRSYPDERSASVSTNLHALIALRHQPGFPHCDKAELVTHWLVEHMQKDIPFADKWNISPFYSASHAIEALSGLDNAAARRCVSFLAQHQQDDGGWGWYGAATLEETAFCVMGLAHAFSHGLLNDSRVLSRAAQFMTRATTDKIYPYLWIGKTLFQSGSIVRSSIYAAHKILARLSYETGIRYQVPTYMSSFEDYISSYPFQLEFEVA